MDYEQLHEKMEKVELNEKFITLRFTKQELKALNYVLGNGYGDGDIYEMPFFEEDPSNKDVLVSGWTKITNASLD